MSENLINRISFYLASGGLFNPELADHIAVRTLLFECREALAQRTWVGLTEDEAFVRMKLIARCAGFSMLCLTYYR